MLILAAILAIFVYGMVAPMLGTIMPTLHMTPEQSGRVALAQALGLVIASLAVGPLIDNKGKKAALVAGLALVAVALFWVPNTSGFAQRLICWLVYGLGGGIIVTGANALASDVSESKRASTLNFLNLFFGLGGMATPFLAANLLRGDAVKLCYTVAVLAVVTLGVQVATRMPPPSGERGYKMSEAGVLLGRPLLYLLALFLFLYVACEVGVWNWLASYLVSRQIPKDQALNILSLGFAFGLLLGRLVVSRILFNVRAVSVTLGASILMAITTFLMLQTSDPRLAWVAVFSAGVAMAPVFPTTLAIVGDAFPRATATAMGIVITSGWIGLAVSSPLIGQLGGDRAENLKTALLVLPAFSVVMVALSLVLRVMLGRKPAAPAVLA